VLDVVPESGTPNYEQRRAMLESLIPTDAVFGGDTWRGVPCGSVVLTPTIPVLIHAPMRSRSTSGFAVRTARSVAILRGRGDEARGFVYPVQMRHATEEFRGWVKHRFLT
jgi:hypothetical protein